MRAAFFGSPEFAVGSLHALCDIADVCYVVTQPDKPQGRGQKLSMPPVKAAALARGINVVQPASLKGNAAFVEHLTALELDVAVVVAYGKILPVAVLSAPRAGCINVHASLLPRWRGAAPVARAIEAGDAQTGVCLMQMEAGLDTGPVFAREVTAIGDDETAGELMQRLAGLGASCLREHLAAIVQGLRPSEPQCESSESSKSGESRVTYARMLTKSEGKITWTRPARDVHNHIRAMNPWPGAFASFGPHVIKMHRSSVANETGSHDVSPGMVIESHGDTLVVACERGAVLLRELQRAGSKRMPVKEFLSGFPIPAGAQLT